MYGGDSIQYEEAIQRTDDNLGAILDGGGGAEETCKTSQTCEDWTVIVVTDHGHQPQQGFGHGFQSPRETETFVIVDGPQFGDSVFNPNYEIVDVTPTVLSLFGAPQRARFDGVPLTVTSRKRLRPSDSGALQDTLKAQIASNDYPNIIVNVALSLRTIVAFVPYYVHGAGLPAPTRRHPVRGDERPRAGRRLLDRRTRRQHLPAVAAAAGDHVHTGGGNVD